MTLQRVYTRKGPFQNRKHLGNSLVDPLGSLLSYSGSWGHQYSDQVKYTEYNRFKSSLKHWVEV